MRFTHARVVLGWMIMLMLAVACLAVGGSLIGPVGARRAAPPPRGRAKVAHPRGTDAS